jgi:hypothetical protein
MKSFQFLVVAVVLTCVPFSKAFACDIETGRRVQKAAVYSGGAQVANWTAEPGTTKVVVLPNGVRLGVEIEAASEDWYADHWKKKSFKFMPEFVEVKLTDHRATPPVHLTRTWAGANSIQSYGAEGGADRVEELGSPGIDLVLHRPVCTPTPAP